MIVEEVLIPIFTQFSIITVLLNYRSDFRSLFPNRLILPHYIKSIFHNISLSKNMDKQMVCLALLSKTRQEQELQVELVRSQTHKGRQYRLTGEPLKVIVDHR